MINVVHIHMDFYSAVKKNVIMKLSVKWMEIQNIMNEIAHAQKEKCTCSLLFVNSSSKSLDVSVSLKVNPHTREVKRDHREMGRKSFSEGNNRWETEGWILGRGMRE